MAKQAADLPALDLSQCEAGLKQLETAAIAVRAHLRGKEKFAWQGCSVTLSAPPPGEEVS